MTVHTGAPTVERRRLSSRLTLLMKATTMIFGLGVVLIGLTLHAGEATPYAGAVFVVAGLLCTGFGYWLVGRARHVEMADSTLFVTSGSRTIEVPLAKVKSVGGSRLTNPERVWLDLRQETEFGSRIYFLPRYRFFRAFTLHPIVEELQSLVSSADETTGIAEGQDERLPRTGAVEGIATWQKVVAAVLAAVGILGGFLWAVMAMLTSSEPYRNAMEELGRNPAAVEILGEPIKPGWYLFGVLNTSADGGEAAMSVPVSGPRDRGWFAFAATRQGGEWRFAMLELHTSGEVVDLLEAPEE